MNTQNTFNKWMRRISGLMAVLMLTMSFSAPASARIIFQDDDFADVDSEGLIINADDGGDEDVTLQLGNDGTDATVGFDDGTGDITFTTPGDDLFTFDNGTLTSTSDAGFNFSTSDQFRIREDSDPDTNAACGSIGELIFDTTDNQLQRCTATGTPGTWTNIDTTGGSSDFEAVYGNDGDDTLTTSNGNFSIAAGTGDVNIDADNISFDGTNASNFSIATDAAAEDLTLEVTGATDSSVVISSSGTGTDAIDINATAGDIDIDASGDNAITIDATESSSFTLTSDAAGEDFTIGLAGATDSSLILNSTGTGSDAIDINATGTGGSIDVDTTDGAVNINAAGAANGDVIIGAGDDFTLDAVGLLELNSSAGVISIGNDDIDQAINVGTDGERTITIGNTNGATALDFNANGAIGVNSDDGSVTIGADDTDNAGNDNVVLLSGNAAPDAGENGNDIALEAEDAVLIEATGAFDVDAASADITTSGQFAINTSTWDITGAGAASGFTTIGASGNITTSGGDFFIGSTGLTETNGGGDNGATLIGVDQTEFANSSSTNVQDVLDDLDALIGSNAPNVDSMTFEPEFPNYALFADGSANKGKMEVLYDNTNREQYYRWTTRQNSDQDMDIRFRYELPADYSSAGSMTIRLRNDTNTAGDNSLAVIVRNDTDNGECHNDGATTASAANTWETITITGGELETGCTGGDALDPGDVIEVQLKLLADDTSSGGTDVGTLSFAYTN